MVQCLLPNAQITLLNESTESEVSQLTGSTDDEKILAVLKREES